MTKALSLWPLSPYILFLYCCFVLLGNANSDNDRKIHLTLTEGTNVSAAIAPAGDKIALDLQGTLWLLPADGGKAEPITDQFGDARLPAWSPNGEKIAFQAYWDGNYHIYTIDPLSREIEKLTSGKYDHREPHWSSDRKQLAFSSDRSGNYDIWSLNIEDNALQPITQTQSFDESAPFWSHTGTDLFYIRKLGGEFEIIEQNLIDQKKIHHFHTDDKKIFGLALDFQGKNIYFNMLDGLRSGLYRLAIDSTSPVEAKVIADPTIDVFPFRPTFFQNSIFFSGSGKIWKHTLADAVSSEIPLQAEIELDRPHYVPYDRNYGAPGNYVAKGIYQPTISPDGKHIAFIALTDLYYKSLDDKPIQITNDRAVQLAPAWSEDNQKLAYASDAGGVPSLWIYNIENQLHQRLVDLPALPTGIAWSSDDEHLAYSINLGPRAGHVAVVEVQSGKTSKIGNTLPFSISAPCWSNDQKTIAISVLQPYSTLYREGINRIVLLDVASGQSRSPNQPAHWSFGMRGNDGPQWSPEGSLLAFLSQGFLWTVEINDRGDFIGIPHQQTEAITDSPKWFENGRKLFYQSAKGLGTIDLITGERQLVNTDLSFEILPKKKTTVIRGGYLIDGIDSTVQKIGDLVIRGNRILSIEAGSYEFQADTVIDATGRYLVPGLIDIHSHQGSEAGSSLGRKWLSWGITTTRDPATNPYDALNRREGRWAGRILSPRIFFTGSPFDGNRIYYGGTYALQNKQHMELEFGRASALDYDMIKTYVRLQDPWQKSIIEKAHLMGLPVSSHEIFPAAALGIDGVEHILGTSRRGYSPKMSQTYQTYDDVIKIIAKSGISFTPTIGIYVGYDYALAANSEWLEDDRIRMLEPPRTLQSAFSKIAAVQTDFAQWEEKFKNATKMIRDVHEQGGLIVAGTDGPIIPFGFGLHVEMLCYQMAGLTPFEVLQTATINAAKAMHAADQLGSIEPNKFADILIVKKNPLLDIKNLRHLEKVVLDGQIINPQDLLTESR